MKIVKITLSEGVELFVPFDELDKFDARIADIRELKGIEMAEKDYNRMPISNQSDIFFK